MSSRAGKKGRDGGVAEPLYDQPGQDANGRVAWVQPRYGEDREWGTPDRFAVDRVVSALEVVHGSADLCNRQDAVEELVWIPLTRQTHRHNALRSWQRIVDLGGPEALLGLSEEQLAAELADAGFSRQKARWIKGSLEMVVESFGRLSLAETEKWDDGQLERFLLSLPGIAIKSARCVMMYSLGRAVLPVDTHLRRLTERLGWVAPKLSERAIHQQLEALVEPEQRYSLHVNAIWHGRAVCRALHPRCQDCVVRWDCRHAALLALVTLV